MKFFSVLGGKKDRSSRSTSRSRSNGRGIIRPEVQNIVSNKRSSSFSSFSPADDNERSMSGPRGSDGIARQPLSNSVLPASWSKAEPDVTPAALSRNQRFPLSTTSDPWSQATWPDEDDSFLVQTRGQAMNTTEWAVPTDLADPWQGRATDSWDGIGTRDRPIAIEEDPLATREIDILARQQRSHDQAIKPSGFESFSAQSSTRQSMNEPGEHRLYSSDTILSEDGNGFLEDSFFPQKHPTSPTMFTEVSGLTNPSYFRGKIATSVTSRTVNPFDVMNGDHFKSNVNREALDVFADPFTDHFHDIANDPALDCVDINSDGDETNNTEELIATDLVQQKRFSRIEPKPESPRVRSPSIRSMQATGTTEVSVVGRSSSLIMIGTPRTSQRPSPRSSPIPNSPTIRTRATPASPVVPKPPEPRMERFRGQDHGKIMAARRGMFNQNTVPVSLATSEHESIKKVVDRRSEPTGFLATSLPATKSTNTQRNAPERLSSVGSDIRRLRSILRRNSRIVTEDAMYAHSTTSIALDENDPMQRAGLRLLAAAVIPIQCMVRKHLALREALTRMWAIVMIQACARRWFVTSEIRRKKNAATKIQSLYRAGVQRDQLLLQQCCAIEIQRHVRGLLATLDVYEKIYNLTIIQAAVRRYLAMNRAMDRMVSIIQIQSITRTYLVRKELVKQHAAATRIQTLYRSFSGKFNYQLDLLDIIIVQSVWRRKIAEKLANSIRLEREYRAAVIIQTQWRSYDCTMNYLHFLADVLIAQSAVRRWKARKVASTRRHRYVITIQSAVRMWRCKTALRRVKAAIMIQKAWRGFVAYADYMFAIADIVIVQSIVRRRLAIKRRFWMHQQQREHAATTIQRYWRRFVSETELLILKYEHQAATLIQAQWRRFWHFSNFIIALDSSMTIQSTVRGYQARQHYLLVRSGAITLQRAIRLYQHCQSERVAQTAHKITSFENENISARLIQAHFRGYVILKAYENGRDAFLQYLAARKIQTHWRRRAARIRLTRENLAATKIQSVYRGNSDRIHVFGGKFLKSVSPLSSTQIANAVTIQKTWRTILVRRSFKTLIAIRKIQATWRSYVVRTAYKEHRAATKIQAMVRGYLIRFCFWKRCAATIIQRFARAYLCTTPFHKYASARTIQKSWRGYTVRSYYRQQIVESSRVNLACTKIQRQTRRFLAQMSYLETIGSVIVVQTIARRYLAYKEYQRRRIIKLICDQARNLIDGRNQNFDDLVHQQERENAARKIQRFFLWVKAEVDREIRYQEKRLERKQKKRMRKSRKEAEEDALLDMVYENVADGPEAQTHIPARSTVPKKYDRSFNDPHMIAIPEEYRGVYERNQISKQGVSRWNRAGRFEDGETVISDVSSTCYYKVPAPRLHTLKRSELDEDFCLEEAWIDTEIKNARERRQADRMQRKASKPSRRR